jgi:hypothetical protein
MHARESGKFGRVRRGARHVSAHHREQGRVHVRVCVRGGIGEARDPRLGGADEGSRAPDLAHWPQREREVKHRPDAAVISEPERQIVVTSGLEQGERAFEARIGVDEFSGEPVGHTGDAMRDAGFGRIGSRLDVREECRHVCPRRRQFASDVATNTQAVIDN